MTSSTTINYTIETIDATDRSAVVLAYEGAWAGDPNPAVDFGKRYDWLCAANPAGQAQLLRVRTSTNESVSMVANLPRRLRNCTFSDPAITDADTPGLD